MRWPKLPRGALRWVHVATTILAWLLVGASIAYVVWPIFHDPHMLGGHDWDQQDSYRYLAAKTILRYHQFPFWNPYSCGGHTVWGGFESDTTIVSPFLPAYLTLSLPLAVRVEVVGSAVLSAIGAWLFAGRFTRSPAARALVVVLFAADNRWALQIAAGHTWHLAYEWTPWALYFLDRAIDSAQSGGSWLGRAGPGKPSVGRNVVGAGACLAMMVYAGGIYPLPQTIVAIALYAIFLAASTRDFRPVLCAAASGVVSLGLAAPKLLPVLEVVSRFPRIVDSPEMMDFNILMGVLTSRDSGGSLHTGIPLHWAWHEWGMYIGLLPTLLLLAGAFLARGPRADALKWAAVLLLAFAFGSVHPDAPWPLLRKLPIFRSQHVPSRWLYPALLVFAVVAAAAFERWMVRAGRWRSWLELAAIAGVATIALDASEIAREPMLLSFERQPPRAVESMGPFHTEQHMPSDINYPVGDWAPPSLPAEIANIGTTDCGTFSGLHNYYRSRDGKTPGLGAKGRDEAGYKGEVFVSEGEGKAEFTSWTPNQMVVQVTGAHPGEHLVLNQNYDSGWLADGERALAWDDLVASPIRAPNETIVFRYRPRTWWFGLWVFGMTVLAMGVLAYVGRRSRALGRRRRPLLDEAKSG